MTMENNDTTAQLSRIADEMKSKLAEQSEQIRKHGETSAATAKQIEALGQKSERLEAELRDHTREMAAKSARIEGQEARVKSLGTQFVESGDLKRALEDRVGNLRVKVAMTTDANFPGLVVADRQGYYEQPREAHIRDLFAQGTTTSNSIEFPMLKAVDNNAAFVADDGVTVKPESNLDLELHTFKIATLAHLTRVHKNTLEDLPFLRSIIDTEMVEGLLSVEDSALIRGTGAGASIEGVLMHARTFTRGVAGESKLDRIRRMATDLRLRNYSADAVLINPLDWEDIELSKGTDGHYVWAVVTGTDGQPRIWRMPVRDTTAVNAGEVLAGNFKRGGMVVDRSGVSVELFEQDRNNVELNLVTIRVERRLGLLIKDQNAFVKGSFN